MKRTLVTYLKIFLPILFICYLGGIILFTHVHIENGVTIVHSHPYKKGGDIPEHTHTGSELQLLHQLSTILLTGPAAQVISLATLPLITLTLLCNPVLHTFICPVQNQRQLRAPPVINN